MHIIHSRHLHWRILWERSMPMSKLQSSYPKWPDISPVGKLPNKASSSCYPIIWNGETLDLKKKRLTWSHIHVIAPWPQVPSCRQRNKEQENYFATWEFNPINSKIDHRITDKWGKQNFNDIKFSLVFIDRNNSWNVYDSFKGNYTCWYLFINL